MAHGIHCPVCHSEHTWVHGARILPDDGLVWDIRCLNCQTAFVWRETGRIIEMEPPANMVSQTIRRIVAWLRR